MLESERIVTPKTKRLRDPDREPSPGVPSGARLCYSRVPNLILKRVPMSLTPQQLQKIEVRLHEERVRLGGELQAFTGPEAAEDSQSQAGDSSKFPTHPADLGTDVAREELEASIATRRSSEVAEIDAALERLNSSPETFGLDENSGEAIPFARLDIIPWARTAV